MKLSASKSKQIIFRARGLRGHSAQPLPPCLGIERVSRHSVLDILVNDRLTTVDHVHSLLSSCASVVYALRVLRSHGTPTATLHDVFRATVIATMTYCAPAWSGSIVLFSRLEATRLVPDSLQTLQLLRRSASTHRLVIQRSRRYVFKHVINNSQYVLQPMLPANMTHSII